jgi:hypothetical protein
MRLPNLKRSCAIALATLVLACGGVFALRAQEPPAGGEGGAGGMGRFPGIRGTITAVSGSDYTLKTEEGATYKVQTGANTRFTKQRQPIKASDIHVGDMVVAIGQVDESAHSVGAAVLAMVDPEQVKRMKESFGKTWIAGTITAIDVDNLKISLKLPEGGTQTIAVDENTSFKKRRESITLADIKVGDSIGGQGALQNGTFVAKELRVGEPGQMRGFGTGRGRGAGTSTPDKPDAAPTTPQAAADSPSSPKP